MHVGHIHRHPSRDATQRLLGSIKGASSLPVGLCGRAISSNGSALPTRQKQSLRMIQTMRWLLTMKSRLVPPSWRKQNLIGTHSYHVRPRCSTRPNPKGVINLSMKPFLWWRTTQRLRPRSAGHCRNSFLRPLFGTRTWIRVSISSKLVMCCWKQTQHQRQPSHALACWWKKLCMHWKLRRRG